MAKVSIIFIILKHATTEVGCMENAYICIRIEVHLLSLNHLQPYIRIKLYIWLLCLDNPLLSTHAEVALHQESHTLNILQNPSVCWPDIKRYETRFFITIFLADICQDHIFTTRICQARYTDSASPYYIHIPLVMSEIYSDCFLKYTFQSEGTAMPIRKQNLFSLNHPQPNTIT